MKEGIIIGTGKGNPEWNHSAPHGTGRKLTRGEAKTLSVDKYKEEMKKVWTTCVSYNTIDESPMAYKSSKIVKQMIEPTVQIDDILKSVYNFKK